MFISGDRDPVGGMGKGVADIAEMLDEAGVSDLTCRIYKGEKHEIIGSLSDAIAKEEILSWLNDKTEAAVALRRTHLFG